MNSRRLMLAGSTVALALIVTGCSSSSSGSSGGKTSSAPSSSAAAGNAAAVEKAFGIDASKCATDPAKPFGSSVKVGMTYAMSGGPASALAPVGQGVKVAFQAFADSSTLPTKFTLIQGDDQFAPDKALTATQQLVQQDKVGLMTGTIGTAQVLAIRNLLATNCIPLIATPANGQAANDPSKYPWVVPWVMTSALDARIWAADVAARHPDGAKVAVYYSNDASGDGYLAAIKTYLAKTKSTIVSTQSIEDTDSAAPSEQVTTMRNSGANVLLAAPTGSQCVPLMKEVANQGWKADLYTDNSCPTTLFDLAGASANGWYINQYTKDPTRAPYNTDPAVLTAIAQIKKYSPSTPINNASIAGLMYTEPFFAAVKAAAASPLGLSPLGVLQAATHLTFQPDLIIPGIKYSVNYPTDEVAMEASELTQYVSSSKTFTNVKLYDFEGQMTGIASTR